MSSGKVVVVMFMLSVVEAWLVLSFALASLAAAGFALYFGARERLAERDERIASLERKVSLTSDDLSFLYERVAEIDNLIHGRTVLGSDDVHSLQRWVDDSLSQVSRIGDFLDSLK